MGFQTSYSTQCDSELVPAIFCFTFAKDCFAFGPPFSRDLLAFRHRLDTSAAASKATHTTAAPKEGKQKEMTFLTAEDCMEMLGKGQVLPEATILALCEIVKAQLSEESNVQPVSSPVTVCGDIHGQFWDLIKMLSPEIGGSIPETAYIFMGDFVDRGRNSLETFSLLLVLKARYPSRITLLRGNHESRQITQAYGFYDECITKYGNATVWKACCQVFDYLNLAALIDGSILCVHGGLSPEIRTLDQIRTIARAQEIPHEGSFCDLMWSDPDDVASWSVSPRGAGWLFGKSITHEWNHVNGLDLIARAHQLVQEGWKMMFDEQLVTVWSAPNYCYRCGNVASVMKVREGAKVNKDSFTVFDQDPGQGNAPVTTSSTASQYFL